MAKTKKSDPTGAKSQQKVSYSEAKKRTEASKKAAATVAKAANVKAPKAKASDKGK